MYQCRIMLKVCFMGGNELFVYYDCVEGEDPQEVITREKDVLTQDIINSRPYEFSGHVVVTTRIDWFSFVIKK